MKDKTIRMNWEEWIEYCAEHDIDPRKQSEDGYDLGGGYSISIICVDVPPEEKEKEQKRPGYKPPPARRRRPKKPTPPPPEKIYFTRR